MADETAPSPVDGHGLEKARDILTGMFRYRIDPTRVKLTDNVPHKKGGQSAVIVGILAPLDPKAGAPEMRVAVKKLIWNFNDPEGQTSAFKGFVNELGLMASLSHPNIVTLTGFVEEMQKGDIWIILPWEENGDVREFLLSGEWDLPERISLIHDVIKGVEYLHTRHPPICHGDLKSLNILVNSSYTAVITDFGSARVISHEAEDRQVEPARPELDGPVQKGLPSPTAEFNPSTLELTLTGPGFSLRWTAPEVLDNGVQSLPSDMWAVGWICWEIVTGKIPFEELNREAAIVSHVVRGKLPAIREDGDLSHVLGLCGLMSDCWASKPAERVDASTFQRKVDRMPSATLSGYDAAGLKVRSATLLRELGNMDILQDDKDAAKSRYQQAIRAAVDAKDDIGAADALNGLGNVYYAQAKYQDAEGTFKKAHLIHTNIGAHAGAANSLTSLGQVYRAQSKYREARQVYTQALEIYSRIGNHFGIGNALHGLGHVYRGQSKFYEAEKAFNQAFEAHSRVGNDTGGANTLIGLGTVYYAQSKYNDAEKAFKEAYRIHAHIGDGLSRGNALSGLGQVYLAQSKFREAEKAFKEAREIYSRIGSDVCAANSFYLSGEMYSAQSKLGEAEKSFQEAQKLYSHLGDDSGLAKTLNALGEIYYAQSKYRETEEAFVGALEINSRVGDDSGVARALDGLGQVYHAQSKHHDAEKAFMKALNIHSRVKNNPGTAKVSRGLATLYCDQGLFEESENWFNRAISAWAGPSHQESRARTMLGLGRAYLIQKRYFKAEETVNEALSIFKSIPDNGGLVTAFTLLSQIFSYQSKHKEAIGVMTEIEETVARTGNNTQRARILVRLGDLYLAQASYSEAEESYFLAQAISLSLEDYAGHGVGLRSLGRLYDLQGRFEEAEEHFVQARAAYASMADHDGEAAALDGLMMVYIQQCRFAELKIAYQDSNEVCTRMGKPMSMLSIQVRELLASLD